MSGAYDDYLEKSDLGLSSIPDKWVCHRHIEESHIKKFIKKESESGTCDYCDRTTGVISLEQLMMFIMETVAAFYTDPANFMGYNTAEGGYLGTIYDGWEILTEEFQLEITHNELFDDMEGSIAYDKAWGDENEYYDDEADILSYHWNYFKEVVKHRSRYLFANTSSLFSREYRIKPFDILKDIGAKVTHFKMIRKLDAGTVIYRCRQHEKSLRIKDAEELCAPDIKYAVSPNRMSPAGISMLYGAFEISTCLKETLFVGDKKRRYYTTCGFKTKHDLNLIDFSLLPRSPSPFDEQKRKNIMPIAFLREFVKDLSKPVQKDGMVHIEYVPTQIVTEYFRYTYSDGKKKGQKIDGIIYPSAREKGKLACVLFMNHKESLDNLDFLTDSIDRRKV